MRLHHVAASRLGSTPFNFNSKLNQFTIRSKKRSEYKKEWLQILRKQFSHEVAACCSHAASAHGLWATPIHKPRMGRQEERFLVPAHPSARVSEDSVLRIDEPQQQTSIGGFRWLIRLKTRVDLLDRKCRTNRKTQAATTCEKCDNRWN